MLTVFAFLAAAQIGSAAVVTTVTNYVIGSRSLMITDNTGAVLAPNSFEVAVGIFEGGSFVRNGATDGGTNPAFGGPFNATLQDPATSTDGSDNFVGKNVVVAIFAAGTDPVGAAPDEVILVDSGLAWPQEAPAVGASVTADISVPSATILQGAATVTSGAGGPFAYANGQGGVTFVPEPSTSLLAGLAGLALLIRRKR